MNQDNVTAMDIARSLPGMLRRFPAIAKGYYYYSVKDKQKALTLGTLVENNAEKYRDRPAILFEDRRITWGEFNAWSNRIAAFFLARGLKKGDSIAVLLENRPELLAVVTGAAKIGVACAMMNTSQKGRVLEHSAGLVSPKMVVVGEELVATFDAVKANLEFDHPSPFLFVADSNTLETFGNAPSDYINMAQEVSTCSSDNPVLTDPPRMGDTAIFLYTSGTTGLPKAAPGSHNKFLKAYGGFGLMSLSLTPEDVFYCTLPLYHGTGLVVCWGATLAGGSAFALRRKFSASAFWDDVRHYNATTFGYIGELCRYLLNQPPSEQDRNHRLTKMLGNGLRPSIWKEFKDRFGIETISELYASSEGNIGFSNFFNMDNTVGLSTAPYKLVKFHDGTRDPIRDDNGRMQEVVKGEPGLLIGEITKKWFFEGYTQKEATEKSILRDAFKDGDAWFNTGDVLKDIGCRHLQFVDRMGDTFRWKGENVSTNEVENIIDGSGMVKEAIVYGVEIPNTNGKAGMVTLVPSGNNFDPDKLLSYLQDNLPAYAVPVFMRVTDAIDTTGTFKYRKVDIQNAGYSLDRPHEEVFAWLPKTEGYTLLTPELVSDINSGQFKF
ncbi:long-chain-acyl-CoA synthetase [Marinobacter adhaerens]|uniref:Long-chain-acyl-CoA synthetase n=1 Tax=Marinobacter adhaerens TaxID=1033846 RepID=A0A851HP49_9GAMM|nr:long-chain-acyl-CoA synthetase [Marinobacter adhaerens]NWN91244.1 long-chain-acyl-CoA synthetase [Marinobacter adhaerens]